MSLFAFTNGTALGFPSRGRALLVEKLLASLAGEANPVIERTHLDEVRRRRVAVRDGQAVLVDGPVGLRQARAASIGKRFVLFLA